LTELHLTHRHHRKTIDLADSDTAGFHQDQAPADIFSNQLAKTIQSVNALLDRIVDMFAVDQVRTRLTRDEVSFAQQIANVADVSRQPLPVFNQSTAVFENSSYRTGIKMADSSFADDPGDQPCIRKSGS
jgi:hypothetical protein